MRGVKARFLTFVRNDMEAGHALEMDSGLRRNDKDFSHSLEMTPGLSPLPGPPRQGEWTFGGKQDFSLPALLEMTSGVKIQRIT